jgi:hypothetical protein
VRVGAPRDPCHEFAKVPFRLTPSRERPQSLRVVKYPPVKRLRPRPARSENQYSLRSQDEAREAGRRINEQSDRNAGSSKKDGGMWRLRR